jgi:hypothetical protein
MVGRERGASIDRKPRRGDGSVHLLIRDVISIQIEDLEGELAGIGGTARTYDIGLVESKRPPQEALALGTNRSASASAPREMAKVL